MKKTSRPYHKYVFDSQKRLFVGQFEKMYRNEKKEDYDSWYQEKLTELDKQIPLLIMQQYNFNRILDIGCGKGAFTHLLKKENNYVLGVDISETAISIAKRNFPEVDFKIIKIAKSIPLDQKFDLIVAMEILSYLKNWRNILKSISKLTDYFLLTLYLPNNPIGFVKSFDELIYEIKNYYDIKTEICIDKKQMLIFAKIKT